MHSVPETTANNTAPEESLDFLFKNFTVAIGALIALSAIVQLVINWFAPGA